MTTRLSRRLAHTLDRLLRPRRLLAEERALGRRHATLAAAVEHSAATIVITDPQGTIEYVNPRFTAVSGYTPEEAIGQNPRLRKSGRHSQDFYGALWQTILSGSTWRGEFANRKKSGEIYWERASISPVIDDHGAITNFVSIQEDMTEQRQIEAALHESQERTTLALEAERMGVWEADTESGQLTWSDTLSGIFGLSHGQGPTTYAAFLALIHPDDRTAVAEGVRRAIRERTDFVNEFRTIWPDGTVQWIAGHARLANDAAGRPTRMIGVGRAVTDRKRTDEELRFQNAMLATERELTLDGVLVVDDRSRVLSFNRRFVQMWGLASGIEGTSADAAFLQAVRDKLPDPQRFMDKVRYLDAHRDETSRDEIELTDGRTFDRYSAPMHALDGVYYGRVWYFRDVTGVKAAEAALRRQRDLAQRYLDVAQVLLLALDVQGRITLVNRKGCSILEWEEHDLLGRDWFETCLPESVRADMRARFADLLDDALTTHENPVLTRSGRQRLIAWRNTLVRDDAGRVIGTLSSGEDITHRKQLETQLRQSQKMEAIGSLAGGVAHDFNNLLTAILGYAAFVAETLDPADPRRQDMDEITRAADRATGLTRQLLAFSRKQVLRPARLDVNGLISTMSRMLRRLIGEDIELVTNLAADLAPVLADAGQIEQILLNLAVNARDAMPHGGRLLIETANVVLDEAGARPYAPARSGPYVMFTVADTGVGMDERTKRRLFEPFFTTKEPGRGTGLGLATVHGIVEQSGGFISLDSQPGHGARFSVYLPPTAETAIADEPNVASDAVLTGSESILVVEDEQAVRSLARVILAKAGYQVFDAPDPASAAEVFSRHADSIDLVLTDVIMPGSTGPSLFSRLAADRPHLKVLYMSGYANEAVLQRAGITSGIDFLQKPFSSDALLRKVRDALGKRQK